MKVVSVPIQFVVVAKQPRPGKAKTRLCPPCHPHQAADLAAAALADTLDVVDATPAARRVLLLDGTYAPPAGWHVVPQRGDGLGARLAHGFADTALPEVPTLLIGMDTPQVTPPLLGNVASGLSNADAVLGMAADGGWWTLALSEPDRAKVLAGVPMSRPDTGRLTLTALRECGLRVELAPSLRDFDTAADLPEVAAACPDTRFARAVDALGLR